MKLFFAWFCLLAWFAHPAPAAEPAAAIRIVVIGDSTVSSYKPDPSKPPIAGWGQVIGESFDDRINVINLAASGRSSKSFVKEGLWTKALEKRPDYMLIQFGHNDCPGKGDRTTDPNGDYRDYLRQYISETRKIGAKPILITPVARRTFKDGKITSTLIPYAEAMIAIGKSESVPVIDLHTASVELFNRLGDEGSADLSCAPEDRTHFSPKGAKAVSALIIEQLPQAEPSLKPYLKAPRTSLKRTFTYKTVADLPIQLDAYLPDQPSDAPRPVMVHIHGGALILGQRGWIDLALVKELLDLNCVVVSLDYRLAPETKLPDILSDVEDAFRWLRGEGSRLLNIDPERVAVFGGSAGGYLTLTTGYRVEPRPKALVSFWGYGDLVGPWLIEPSSHPRHRTTDLTEEAARSLVNGPPVSEARQRKNNAGPFYNYCREHAIWPREVSGWDPKTEVDKFVPCMPLRNVTAEYPPTLLIHGTQDTDVPYEQSRLMAEQLQRHGVKHRLITVDGAEHGLAGADKQVVREANRAAIEFLREHLQSK